MNTWPNWIDLIVVTIVLKISYSGYTRGFLTEFLLLAGACTVTALTFNYAGDAKRWLESWVAMPQHVPALIGFWGIFLILALGVRFLIRSISSVLKWERVHWVTQGLGLVLGSLRALWWSGFLLLVLTSSGITFLRAAVEERSVLGPQLVRLARTNIERVADWFPGAESRGGLVIPLMLPPVKAHSQSR